MTITIFTLVAVVKTNLRRVRGKRGEASGYAG